MPDLILHHYDGSPFSEKLRLIFGFKGLAWASVKIPVIMPKPDLVALTGGYRKTPVVQVGADASIADFAVAHCGWYVRRAGLVADIFKPHTHFSAWLDRVLALGHGRPDKMSSAEALAVAAAVTTHAPCAVAPGLGFEAGQAVRVAATDYGQDPVAGTLVGLSNDEVVLRRTDERAGSVHVHFPRAGFQLKLEPLNP